MNDEAKSSSTIQKTTLDALVRKKFNIGRTHPATITQVLGTHTYAKVMPPILRRIQAEHSDILVESPLQIHAEGLTEDMHIMTQYINGQWRLSQILSSEAFLLTEQQHIHDQLLIEAETIASPLARRAAKRKFETWFGLSPQESHPWALPGLMNKGTPIISKKIMQWCLEQGGEAIEQAIRSGSPKVEEWGQGSFRCAVVALDEVQPKFVSVAIEESTYENLLNQWRMLLEKSSSPQNLILIDPSTQNKSLISIPSIPHQQPLARPSLPPEEPPLPHRLLALLELHHLPRPNAPFSDTMRTVIAWTEAGTENFRTRCIDFLLMLLAEGENVRPNPELSTIWLEWHRTKDPFSQLLQLVRPQEEPIAIQALFSPYAPKMGFSKVLSNHLLERWKAELQKDRVDPTPQQDTSLQVLRKSTRSRGLRAADIWVDRLFLSLLSASITQTPILLGAPRQLAQQLMEQVVHPCFGDSHFSTIRLNRRKSHIFGKISRERDIFVHSDLSKAFRHASHVYRTRKTDIWAPYFIFAEDIGNHGRTSDIAQLYTKAHSEQGVMLFSKEENTRWYAEHLTLHSKGQLTPQEEDRRDALEEFFSAERLGAIHPEHSWRLQATPNTLLLAVMDTNHAPKELDILSHAYVLSFPDIDIQSLPVSSSLLPKLETLSFTIPKLDTVDAWEDFPKCREQLFSMMRTLSPCGFNLTPQLSQQVSTLLSIASLWGIPDGPIATSHLFQTLFLPRIRCKGAVAIKPIDELLKRNDLAPDLLKRLSVLRSRAIQHGGEWFHGAIR